MLLVSGFSAADLASSPLCCRSAPAQAGCPLTAPLPLTQFSASCAPFSAPLTLAPLACYSKNNARILNEEEITKQNNNSIVEKPHVLLTKMNREVAQLNKQFSQLSATTSLMRGHVALIRASSQFISKINGNSIITIWSTFAKGWLVCWGLTALSAQVGYIMP